MRMADLRGYFQELSFESVETLLASGNVIFKSEKNSPKSFEAKIAKYLERQLGYEVETFIRSSKQILQISDYEPFSVQAMKHAEALSVGFVHKQVDATANRQLRKFETEVDKFHSHGKEVYWMCTVKQSESMFSNAIFERNLRLKATFRSIKTIHRLARKFVTD